MLTVKKSQIKLYLSDGKTALLSLPEARNEHFVDDDSEPLVPDFCRALAPVFASDDGATVTAADFSQITISTRPVFEKYFPED